MYQTTAIKRTRRPTLGNAGMAGFLDSSAATLGVSQATLIGAIVVLGGVFVLGYMTQPRVQRYKRRFKSRASTEVPAWKTALLMGSTAVAAGIGMKYATSKGWL